MLEVSPGPGFSALAGGLTWNIFFRETIQAISGYLSQAGFPVTFDEIYHDLKPQLKEAWSFLVLPSGDGYLPDAAFDQALWVDRPALQRRFQAMFAASGADALLLPTTPALAPLITSQGKFTVAGHEVDDLFLARNTVPASGAGLPGITVPLGVSANGQPSGSSWTANTEGTAGSSTSRGVSRASSTRYERQPDARLLPNQRLIPNVQPASATPESAREPASPGDDCGTASCRPSHEFY